MEGFTTIVHDNSDDVEKSQHARNQRTIWESFVEMRIKMQKSLIVANKFPKAILFPAFCEKSSKVDELFTSVASELVDVVGMLTELQTALASQNSEVPNVTVKIDTEETRKRPREEQANEIWPVVQEIDLTLKPYLDSSMDKWHRRAQSTQATSSKQLKALNQDIVSQIDSLLADKTRAMKKARLKRSAYRIMGEEPQQQTQQLTGASILEEYDTEIYDDADFYQQLLRELIESGNLDGDIDPALLSQRHLALQKLRAKTKKAVDRRASKGRKVRYNVHEKLVNFMPPIELETMPTDIREDLFNNLFGHNAMSLGLR